MLSYVTWTATPEIFNIGNFSLRYYSLFFAIGFIIAYCIVKYYYKKENIPQKELDKLTIYVVLGGILGARIGHCLFYEPDYFFTKEHFLQIILPFKFSPFEFTGYQGLASHGGAIGVLIAVLFFKFRSQQRSYLAILDKIAIPTGFVGGLIRLGNLMNSEIYGHETNLPWGFLFVQNGDRCPCHPTQIYEAICYIFISLILIFTYKNKTLKQKDGFVLGLFLILIFTARFCIEFFKQNQEAFEENLPLNMGQLLSLPAIIAGFVLIFFSLYRNKLTNKK